MGTGVSPRDGARGDLARTPASWMAGDAGLRRRLAVRAERERR
jgi:hypothetical protein